MFEWSLVWKWSKVIKNNQNYHYLKYYCIRINKKSNLTKPSPTPQPWAKANGPNSIIANPNQSLAEANKTLTDGVGSFYRDYFHLPQNRVSSFLTIFFSLKIVSRVFWLKVRHHERSEVGGTFSQKTLVATVGRSWKALDHQPQLRYTPRHLNIPIWVPNITMHIYLSFLRVYV